MSPEKPIRGQIELTKDTAPIAVSLRAITDRKARGRLRAASTIDAIKTSLTRWVDNEGWTYEFENQPRVTIAEKDIKRAASTVDLKVWDASNTLIFRDRIHVWDGFPVLVPDGTQRQETLLTGEINLVDNFKEDPVEAVKTDLAHTVRVVTKTGTVPWVKDKPGTVSTFYASTNDTSLRSGDNTSYANARAGSNLDAQSGLSSGFIAGQGCSWAFGRDFLWNCAESCFRFDTSALGAGTTVTAVQLAIYGVSDDSGTDFTVEARAVDLGAAVDTGDWVAGADLGALTRVATFDTSGGWATAGYNNFTEDGSNFQSAISLTGNTDVLLSSSRQAAGSSPSGDEHVSGYYANYTGTTRDPKLVVTHTPANTAPTITAGPTTTYASGTCTTPTVTWGVTFTATDSEQTGADALTYYIRTSSTFGAGTQVATGTCTSGVSKAVTGLAYNAPGVVEGTQTLYLHIYDGALNTVTASSFTLVRRFIRSTAGTGGTLSGVLSRAPIYGKAIAGAISSISGALSRVTGKVLTGISGGITGVLAKNTNKAVTGISGLLSASLTRTTQKALLGISGSLSGITSGVKIAVIELVGAISSLSGTVTFSLVFGKALAGSISSITGGISKTISKSLSGALGSLAASIAKSTVKSFSGTAGAVSGTVSKLTSLILVGAASTTSGSLTIGVGYTKAIAGELLSLTGNVSRITFKGLSGSSGAVLGALSSTKLYTKAIAGEIATITGSVTRFVTKSFSGVITGSGILSTAAAFYRTVTGSLSSLSGSFSFRSIIRRVKMKGGSVVRSVISGGSRILR